MDSEADLCHGNTSSPLAQRKACLPGPTPDPTLGFMAFTDLEHKHSENKTDLPGHQSYFVVIKMSEKV